MRLSSNSSTSAAPITGETSASVAAVHFSRGYQRCGSISPLVTLRESHSVDDHLEGFGGQLADLVGGHVSLSISEKHHTPVCRLVNDKMALYARFSSRSHARTKCRAAKLFHRDRRKGLIKHRRGFFRKDL